MLARTTIYSPTDMNESEYYNDSTYVGKRCYFKNNTNYQCTYYANARSSEISETPITYWKGTTTRSDVELPIFARYGFGDAKNWLRDTNWETGKEAKVGAIMVYGANYGSGKGHVRIVEEVGEDTITYSAGNESGRMTFNKVIKKPTISRNGFLGYIYNPYI